MALGLKMKQNWRSRNDPRLKIEKWRLTQVNAPNIAPFDQIAKQNLRSVHSFPIQQQWTGTFWSLKVNSHNLKVHFWNIQREIPYQDVAKLSAYRECSPQYKEGKTLTNLTGRVRQGFLEGSNVDSMTQIARMIEVQRAYEMGQSFAETENERLRSAVRTIIK